MISSRSCSLESSDLWNPTVFFLSLSLSLGQSISRKITSCTCRKSEGERKQTWIKVSFVVESQFVRVSNTCVAQGTSDWLRAVCSTIFFCLPINLFQLLIAFDYDRVDWKMKCSVADLRSVMIAETAGEKSRRNIEFNRGQITRNEAWKI